MVLLVSLASDVSNWRMNMAKFLFLISIDMDLLLKPPCFGASERVDVMLEFHPLRILRDCSPCPLFRVVALWLHGV